MLRVINAVTAIAAFVVGCSHTPPPPADRSFKEAKSPVDCGDSVDGLVAWHAVNLRVPGALLDPTTGNVTTLDTVSWAVPSPDGKKLAAVKYENQGEALTVSATGGAELFSEPVQVFVKAPELDEQRVADLRSSRVRWWNDRELLVIQDLLPSEAYIDCQLFDVETRQWRDASPCPSGDMITLYDVVRGPEDLVAVYSSGEGHPAVNVLRWSPGSDQQDVGVPNVDLYPFGPLYVRFTQDPDVLYFETPCDLRQQRGCFDKVNEADDNSVFLFRWQRGKPLELLREGLPTRATYDPASDRWAWPTSRGVAVGDPEGEFNCVEFEWGLD